MADVITDDELDDLDDIDPNADQSALVRDLRKKLRAANKTAKEGVDAKAELASIKRARVLEDEAFAGLTERQRKALIREHEESGEEFTAENVLKTAMELYPDQVVDTEQNEIDDELDRSEKVTQASQTGKTARSTGVLKPEDTAGWSMERMLRLKDSNPEAFEALKRGESVVAAGIV